MHTPTGFFIPRVGFSLKKKIASMKNPKIKSLCGPKLLYSQATQDGRPPAVCTSSAQPVPASATPHSQD